MAEQAGAQLDVDPVGRVGQHPRPQAGHQDLEERDHHQAEHQHVERAPALVNQDLVDHDLGEKRCDQAEELQKQRADQRLAQEAAEAHDRGDEPREVERPRRSDHALARGHQDEFAGPALIEGCALLDGRPVGGKVLQQHAVGGGARQQREGAVLHQRDRRQGCLLQPLGRGALASRLYLQALGGTQYMVGGEILAVGGELMAELRRIGGLAEEAQEGNERQQPAIQRHPRRRPAPFGHHRWSP